MYIHNSSLVNTVKYSNLQHTKYNTNICCTTIPNTLFHSIITNIIPLILYKQIFNNNTLCGQLG